MKTQISYEVYPLNDYFPKQYEKVVSQLWRGSLQSGATNRIFKVPHRPVGLTSSGKSNECHGNVRKLVDWKGGEQLLGWMVEEFTRDNIIHLKDDESIKKNTEDEPIYILYWHSVWATPERKLIDPTAFHYEKEEGKREFSAFIPWHFFEEGYWTEGGDILIHPDFLESGVGLIKTNPTYGDEDGNLRKETDTYCKKLGIVRNHYIYSTNPLNIMEGYGLPAVELLPLRDVGKKHIKTTKCSIEALKKDVLGGGGFTEPSSFTGRYYDENFKPFDDNSEPDTLEEFFTPVLPTQE